MLFPIIIISVILLVAIIAHIYVDDSPLYVITLIFSILLGVFIMEFIVENRPQAIDVYRGETTLKISYVDSIAVDSIVIFKSKK